MPPCYVDLGLEGALAELVSHQLLLGLQHPLFLPLLLHQTADVNVLPLCLGLLAALVNMWLN